jgi:hypothetical protein
VGLTPEQAASLNTHPRIKALRKQLSRLRRGSDAYKEKGLEIKREKASLERALLQEIKDAWTEKQAVDDIERQLSGKGFAENATLNRSCRPHCPDQKRLVEALLAPAQTTLDAHYQRRNHAIEVVIEYCFVEEGRTKRRSNAPPKPAPPRADKPSPEHPAFQAALSVFVQNEKDRPLRCFLCIGKALSLSPDDPRVEDLVHEFFGPTDLTRHLKRHLNKMRNGDKIHCHVCDMPLDHKMHLQNHALSVHGTVS